MQVISCRCLLFHVIAASFGLVRQADAVEKGIAASAPEQPENSPDSRVLRAASGAVQESEGVVERIEEEVQQLGASVQHVPGQIEEGVQQFGATVQHVPAQVEEEAVQVATSLGLMAKPAADQGSATDDAANSGPGLESFCNLLLGGSQVTEPMFADCSCCATFMVGDYAAQVEMLFGGSRVLAPAHGKDGTLVGEVALWSLGDNVPDLKCRDGPNGPQAMCNCASQDRTWAEYEPTCEAGPSCKRDEAPAEPCSTPKDPDAVGVGGGDSAPVSSPETMVSCPAAVNDAHQSLGSPKIAKRVSIGAARCEDMSAEQCQFFYAKVGDEWRHCQSAVTSVKQCAAVAVPQSRATVENARMEAWAIKNAYTPEAWPVNIREDGTMMASATPGRADLVKQIGNLPRKTTKAYMV